MSTPASGSCPRALPADARRSLLIYNFFFPFAFLALVPALLRRMLRRGNFRENFGQRFARYTAEDRARFASDRWTWIHSISVGETLIALKLARELHRKSPTQPIVISVTTSTGFTLARQNREPWLEVIYNPLDLRSVVRAALDVLRPAQLIFIEGEAWPNLLSECHRRCISTALVNARLSPRSQSRFRRFRSLTGPIFRLLDLVCVPDPSDLSRWKMIGVHSARIRHTGSIKFDLSAPAGASRESEFRALLTPLGITADTPIIVAGSTWAPEETVLANHLLELRKDLPKLFLIIVPRHVERTAEIVRELSPLGLRITRRSGLSSIQEQPIRSSAPADILIVDTTGELRDWYELATVAFVGKSLPGVSEIGGQNPAEPAALGKPVIFGPHMENFDAIVQLLLSCEAAIQVPDSPSLLRETHALLTTPPRRATLSTHARTALQSHQDATAHTVDLLSK